MSAARTHAKEAVPGGTRDRRRPLLPSSRGTNVTLALLCLLELGLYALFPVDWSYGLLASATLAVVTFVVARALPCPLHLTAVRDVASWVFLATSLSLIFGPGFGPLVILALMLTVYPQRNRQILTRQAILVSGAAVLAGLLGAAVRQSVSVPTPIVERWHWDVVVLGFVMAGMTAFILLVLWSLFGNHEHSLHWASTWAGGIAVGSVAVSVLMVFLASYVLVLPAILVGASSLAVLSHRQLTRTQREGRAVIESLHLALLQRDPYTHYHSVRVTQYVGLMLDQLPLLSPDMKATILNAARVHDLGKVAIPEEALSKAGALSQSDWELVQQHPQIGEKIVRPLQAYRESATIVRHHHERWDGKGYPDGLAGHEIPFGSRIIAVADAFDAMTTDRVYRPALPVSVALEELRRQAGRQFDPEVVQLFERCLVMDASDLRPGSPPADSLAVTAIDSGAAE